MKNNSTLKSLTQPQIYNHTHSTWHLQILTLGGVYPIAIGG